MRRWFSIVWICGWFTACGAADIVKLETPVFKVVTGPTAIQSLNGEANGIIPTNAIMPLGAG